MPEMARDEIGGGNKHAKTTRRNIIKAYVCMYVAAAQIYLYTPPSSPIFF